MHAYLVSKSFKNSPTKSTIYENHCDGGILLVTLYDDDLMVKGNEEQKLLGFKCELLESFKKSHLGVQLVHTYQGIYMLHSKYVWKLLNVLASMIISHCLLP